MWYTVFNFTIGGPERGVRRRDGPSFTNIRPWFGSSTDRGRWIHTAGGLQPTQHPHFQHPCLLPTPYSFNNSISCLETQIKNISHLKDWIALLYSTSHNWMYPYCGWVEGQGWMVVVVRGKPEERCQCFGVLLESSPLAQWTGWGGQCWPQFFGGHP